jgi:ankyrin repeat protein
MAERFPTCSPICVENILNTVRQAHGSVSCSAAGRKFVSNITISDITTITQHHRRRCFSRCQLSTGDERMNRTNQELIAPARTNNLPEVLRLLRAGADVNAKTSDNWTPLHVACYNGHLQVFQALREHGADIEATTSSGRTPLHFACAKGHLAVVNELTSPNDSNGATTSILDRRKSRGANIEVKDRFGDTPLHFASSEGHVAIVRVLLSSGANTLTANIQGRLPIHKAVTFRNSEVAKCLLQHFYATIRGNLPLHQLLKDLTWIGNHSISVDVPPLRAALHQDVLGTNDVVEILEYLVDQNPVLLCSGDQDGSLPLHVACRRGASFSIVQFLVNRYKASVKSVTCQGALPLFLACEIPEPSLDTIFLLMKLYPDLVYRS